MNEICMTNHSESVWASFRKYSDRSNEEIKFQMCDFVETCSLLTKQHQNAVEKSSKSPKNYRFKQFT